MTVESLGLPYGDGSNKIFGMENFGNTCYCNLILQCLFYTDSFRTQLVSHNLTKHDRKLTQVGVKPHNFTTKYEQLVAKRTKEQAKNPQAALLEANNPNGAPPAPKLSRKGSLFGIKFNSGSNNVPAVDAGSDSDIGNKGAIFEARACDALSSQQQVLVLKSPDIQNLLVLVTKPSLAFTNPSDRIDYSQSSSTLLNNDSQTGNTPNPATNATTKTDVKEEGTFTRQSCLVVVGIPYPETFLLNPINPYNPNPSPDQRKRSALINGPIVNVDTSLRLPSEESDESALLYALKELFECMIENKSQIGVVSPVHFIIKLKEKNYLFRQNNMHHDAHEFCNYLINETIECLNHEVGVENNWCNKIFQGLITNETKCLSCESITSKEETFLDLSVDIPPGESSYSLTYSLNNFSKLETLTHQNKFYCNTCLSLQEATKTIKLKHLPEVLVINFKRFKYDENIDKMVKLFDSISYPFKLRLFNTADGSKDRKARGQDGDDSENFTLYELYSLVVHIGGGPMHGHYISLCKNKAGLWFLFDDETVEIVDESYVMRFFGDGPGLASAYILFYRKCDTCEDDTNADFGINMHDIYVGHEYALTQTGQAPHQASVLSVDNASDSTRKNSSIGSNIKPNHRELEPSDSSSIDSFTVRELKPGLVTSSLENGNKKSYFKKNFKFDNNISEQIHLIPKSLSRTTSAKEVARTASNVGPEVGEGPPTPGKEKKTWVGGLKRRESRASATTLERKSSVASVVSTASNASAGNANGSGEGKEKRKSIFGFKRK